jgi:hypothetical protein
MNVKLVSSLDRLKAAGPDATDWNPLQSIDSPLITWWRARAHGLREEANHLAKEAFVVVTREIPRLQRHWEGPFRDSL